MTKYYGVSFPTRDDKYSSMSESVYPDPEFNHPAEFGMRAAKEVVEVFQMDDVDFVKRVWSPYADYPFFLHVAGYWRKKDNELYLHCHAAATRYKKWLEVGEDYNLEHIATFPVVDVEFKSREFETFKRSIYIYKRLTVKGERWEDGYNIAIILADKKRIDSLRAKKILEDKGIDLFLGQNAGYEFSEGKVIMRARNLTLICPEEEYNLTTIGNYEETSYIRGNVRINKQGRVIFTVNRNGNAFFFKNSAHVFIDKDVQGLLWKKVNRSTSRRGHSFVNTIGITDSEELVISV